MGLGLGGGDDRKKGGCIGWSAEVKVGDYLGTRRLMARVI